jgi:hypothetical protein
MVLIRCLRCHGRVNIPILPENEVVPLCSCEEEGPTVPEAEFESLTLVDDPTDAEWG